MIRGAGAHPLPERSKRSQENRVIGYGTIHPLEWNIIIGDFGRARGSRIKFARALIKVASSRRAAAAAFFTASAAEQNEVTGDNFRGVSFLPLLVFP